jgi:hypothetical protein
MVASAMGVGPGDVSKVSMKRATTAISSHQ